MLKPSRKEEESLIDLAKKEIQDILKAKENPTHEFFVRWPQAIPQYNEGYPQILENINRELNKMKGLHLVANYLGGISVNDCIVNASYAV